MLCCLSSLCCIELLLSHDEGDEGRVVSCFVGIAACMLLYVAVCCVWKRKAKLLCLLSRFSYRIAIISNFSTNKTAHCTDDHLVTRKQSKRASYDASTFHLIIIISPLEIGVPIAYVLIIVQWRLFTYCKEELHTILATILSYILYCTLHSHSTCVSYTTVCVNEKGAILIHILLLHL